MNRMNAKTQSAGAIRMGLLTLLVMALLAGALAFVVTRYVVPCGSTQPFSVLGDVKHLGRELKLSDRQRVEIEKLQKDLAAQLSGQCRL